MTARPSHPTAPARRRPAAARWAAPLLALALGLAACGSDDTASPSSQVAASQLLDTSVLMGQATTITGETFDLGSLAGKDLVVWFWAPW